MQGQQSISLKLIILCLIAIVLGGLWAADKAGLIDLRIALQKIPVLSKYAKEPAPVPKIPVISPIEQENQKLRSDLKDFETKLTAFENEKTKLLEQIYQLQQELTELRAYKEKNENKAIHAKQLALYYSEMKPEAIVKVMENLDDDTVITILPLLNKEQTGKILALMEPQRAARITQLLLGNQ
ncbi:MAG: MgtE intracellular region [Peptococcaceae bacterium]|jgi:flagellar protein FlbB|nr:MgtE intracellular region [Peptococcaceae bacterium]